ncbi:protein NRT1/ PTR FAMILY 2.7-like isoform X1 [Iris pallida]|uniref:Protein NRT1/ PTR FAMILY 2.7-like isoform X1 n=1 Tax=Iris pallida TaxID=29817 RepID=A0AAX6EHE3_IRIPA|nr:protein NRT1/ PTR FAMILY 2.7-like isoform X1 [Iris pallida]
MEDLPLCFRSLPLLLMHIFIYIYIRIFFAIDNILCKLIDLIYGGGVAGVSMGYQGLLSNLLVYLIKHYHINNADATQILSVVNGCIQFASILCAVVADAIGCFYVVYVAVVASFLSSFLFVLTSAIPSLSPPSCALGPCEAPAGGQLSVLYFAIFLLAVGAGGTRLSSTTFGASQMDTSEGQASFFNWFGMASFTALIIGMTAIVYVEDNMGWVFGFSLCAGVCAVGVLVFHLGIPYYRPSECQDQNPFLTLLRSLGRRIGRKTQKTYESLSRYHGLEGAASETLSQFESSIDRHWLTETEEDQILSSIIRLLPLLSTIIPLGLAINIQSSLIILQAMVMERHLGPDFLIPAASTATFTLVAVVVSIPFLEGIVYKRWHITPLQRIGISHVLVFLAFACTAIIESIRLASLDGPGGAMSVLWLVPPLLLVGLAEAFAFPSQLLFYFQEFPESLRNSSAGVTALMTGIGCYLSTTVVAVIRRATDWWQDDTDQSRLDNVYWVIAAIELLNFGYFLLCAVLYKSRGKTKI